MRGRKGSAKRSTEDEQLAETESSKRRKRTRGVQDERSTGEQEERSTGEQHERSPREQYERSSDMQDERSTDEQEERSTSARGVPRQAQIATASNWSSLQPDEFVIYGFTVTDDGRRIPNASNVLPETLKSKHMIKQVSQAVHHRLGNDLVHFLQQREWGMKRIHHHCLRKVIMS